MAEVQFRDEKREVPEHVRLLLLGIETYKLTYEQAIAEANDKLVRDRLNQVQADILRSHFREVK